MHSQVLSGKDSTRVFEEHFVSLNVGRTDVWDTMAQYDIKDFLKNVIEDKKKRNPRFSQRAFAYQLGFSPSTLNEIIKGKRPLTKKSIEKLKQGLAEDKDLHLYIQSYESDRFPLFHKDTQQVTAVTTKWYYHGVLELSHTSDFQGDAVWIAGRLGISVHEAQECLEQLLLHGGLVKDEKGKIIPSKESRVIVVNKDNAAAIAEKVKSELDKVAQAVRDLPTAERFFGSLVVAVAPEDFEYLRSKMLDVVRDYHKFLNRDGVEKTDVFQLNFSCIPLTTKRA